MTSMIKTLCLIIFTFGLLVGSACTKPAEPPEKDIDEEPIVLEEGSTSQEPEYYIDEEGRVIYSDSRSRLGDDDTRDPAFPPVFVGSQRIYPAGEDPALRESYITKAPYEAIEKFYSDYLNYGEISPDEESVNDEIFVNTINTTDEDGRRQTALFVNESGVGGGGPRGGMKVMLKEFPVQHAVQIVLTTLEATPMGINPMGVYVTPEEIEELSDDYVKQQEEYERRRAEVEESAVDPPVAESDSDSDDENDEEAD